MGKPILPLTIISIFLRFYMFVFGFVLNLARDGMFTLCLHRLMADPKSWTNEIFRYVGDVQMTVANKNV